MGLAMIANLQPPKQHERVYLPAVPNSKRRGWDMPAILTLRIPFSYIHFRYLRSLAALEGAPCEAFVPLLRCSKIVKLLLCQNIFL